MRKYYYKIIGFLLSLSLLTVFILNSCRKLDRTNFRSEKDIVTQFFDLPQNADPRIKAISQIIQRQQQQNHFVVDLVERIGFPVWRKAVILVNNTTTRTTGPDPIDNLILIPFVRGMENSVNAVVLGSTWQNRWARYNTWTHLWLGI